MSDTPRTDAIHLDDTLEGMEIRYDQMRYLAEELERQLAEAHKKLSDLADEANIALQSDMEHGVRWINEQVVDEFQKNFPRIAKLLGDLCCADAEVEE
jgi:hypothetical protein